MKLMGRLLTLLVVSLVVACFVACSTGDAAEPGVAEQQAADGGTPTTDDGATKAQTTYYQDVAPILGKHCLSCHVSGGIAPFPLTTYEEAAPKSFSIVDRTQQRIMPPWGAGDTKDCKVSRPWKNDLSLSDAELATLKKWHEDGAPKGDQANAAKVETAASVDLDDATLSLKPKTGFEMSGTTDRLRCFVIDPNLTAQYSFFDAAHVVPEQKNVVHHVLVYIDPSRKALDKADANGQYDCFGGPGVDGARLLTAWAPGAAPNAMPDGIAMPIEGNSLIVMQVHYHAGLNVSASADHTTLKLRAAKGIPTKLAFIQLIGNFKDNLDPDKALVEPPFAIEANEKEHYETMKLTVPTQIKGRPVGNLRLLGAAGHMHYVGVQEEIRVKRASGEEECLLGLPRWDFDWQRGYQYDVPFDQLPTMQAGDTLSIKCRYDNTMNNPKMSRLLRETGMTQPQQILLGESTNEEMCLGVFTFVLSL